MADCSAMGWGALGICSSLSTSDGSMIMTGILMFIGLLAILAWAVGFILFTRKNWKMGTVVIIAALFLTTAGFLVSIDGANSASLTGTSKLMETFVVVFSDLIMMAGILGLLALIGYIFMNLRNAWGHNKKVREERGEDG